jgi:hypothetical protein
MSSERDKRRERLRKFCSEKLLYLYSLKKCMHGDKIKRIRWTGHAERMEENRSSYDMSAQISQNVEPTSKFWAPE